MDKNVVFWKNWKLIAGIVIVLGLFSSAVKIVVLKDGGSLTYFSMLFAWLLVYILGWKKSIIPLLIYGFCRIGVDYITGETVTFTVSAILLEYVIGYLVFAVGDLVKKSNKSKDKEKEQMFIGRHAYDVEDTLKLRLGFVIGVILQWACFVISARLNYGNQESLLFSCLYDGSYMAVEAVVTLVLLFVPQVVDAICYVKFVAKSDDPEDPSLSF